MNTLKKITHFSFSIEFFERSALTVAVIAAATGLMYLIGRDNLGEGVIALLYLVPVSWITARWGQGPGIVAAITAALSFNFFFIPPYYTLNIGSMEGWLLLGIFLMVAIVVVGRIQTGFSQAKAREREAIFMYELSAALAGRQKAEEIAPVLAENIQQVYQAALVKVLVNENDHSFTAKAPSPVTLDRKPDLVLPIQAASGLLGEIQLWRGDVHLSAMDDRLLQNFANQGAHALERARLVQHRVKTQAV